MKWIANVTITLQIDYEGIEADSEEEAKRIAIDKAYEDVDFNNCYCDDTAIAYAWEDDYCDEEGEQCENEKCEYNEDGFCMKDEYYAECPFED